MEKILVIQAAALGYDFLAKECEDLRIGGLEFRPIESVLPAVTSTIQATFRTGEPPSEHGIIGNGFYSRTQARTFFWEQSSSLMEGTRIWDKFRRAGYTVGQICWQQSLGTDSDLIISPAPVHKHHGGMIQDCYSRPRGLYEKLVETIGRPFDLTRYWGPRTSIKSSDWIARATLDVMRSPAPHLLLSYLPHLDYALQKYGTDSDRASKAFAKFQSLLEMMIDGARDSGYRIVVFGDYAIMNAARAEFPNRALLDSELFAIRRVNGMTYPDLYSSRAFALVDHQVAHVFVKDPADTNSVRRVLEELPGTAQVADRNEIRRNGMDHERTGDLVLFARPDSWFAYTWWDVSFEAPDYASHVDIHNKPGYDPCELFWGTWPFSVSTDPALVRGSHGLAGKEYQSAWTTDMELDLQSQSILGLSRSLRGMLTEASR